MLVRDEFMYVYAHEETEDKCRCNSSIFVNTFSNRDSHLPRIQPGGKAGYQGPPSIC